MARWRELAKAALLSDGRIDTKETDIIRSALFADGRIDSSELEFLYELRRSADSCVKVFTTMFMEAVKSHVLEDGEISEKEAQWLRKAIFQDGEVDEDEKQLLRDIKADAKTSCDAFEELYSECVGS